MASPASCKMLGGISKLVQVGTSESIRIIYLILKKKIKSPHALLELRGPSGKYPDM